MSYYNTHFDLITSTNIATFGKFLYQIYKLKDKNDNMVLLCFITVVYFFSSKN